MPNEAASSSSSSSVIPVDKVKRLSDVIEFISTLPEKYTALKEANNQSDTDIRAGSRKKEMELLDSANKTLTEQDQLPALEGALLYAFLKPWNGYKRFRFFGSQADGKGLFGHGSALCQLVAPFLGIPIEKTDEAHEDRFKIIKERLESTLLPFLNEVNNTTSKLHEELKEKGKIEAITSTCKVFLDDYKVEYEEKTVKAGEEKPAIEVEEEADNSAASSITP